MAKNEIKIEVDSTELDEAIKKVNQLLAIEGKRKTEEADLTKEMEDFAVRVMRGKGNPQETAILPEILKMLMK